MQCVKLKIGGLIRKDGKFVVKKRFEQELEQAKEKANAPIIVKRPVIEIPMFSYEQVLAKYPDARPVHAPCKGQVIWQYDMTDVSSAPFEGSAIHKNDNLCYIQNSYCIEPVPSGFEGTIVGTYAKQGEIVQKGQVLAFVN